ncbi:hypothetical protein [Sphingobium sp. CCH11-B1]|uniref:hypothetical protein n=1 Tax=Sphingobium sp. CCH11-B1 TaxID=1768781 RepID=UPI00082EE1AA|nr:hypothetical protein [Sphingobium sp. CCH11-B1]
MIPQVRARNLDIVAGRLREKAEWLRRNGKPLKVRVGGKVMELNALTSLHLDQDADAFERDAAKLRTNYA